MEKLARYQTILQDLLPSYGEIEVEVSFDTERHHYLIWHTGWLRDRWVHHCPIHFAIRNHKVWLLANSTEHDLGADLVEKGISKHDIVLGFHPTYIREISDYAVN